MFGVWRSGTAAMQQSLPDGRTLILEELGRPLPGKASPVEFVAVMPDGEKIAWAVSRATLEHFLLGYGEKSGLHRLDLTEYFGPHSYKPTIAFHRDSIYILAGNRGPALIRYHIPTRTAKVLRKYDIPYYYLGFARDTGGRLYWSTYPETEVIGVDPETDRIVRVRLDARENPPARRRRIFPIIAECRNPEHGVYLS